MSHPACDGSGIVVLGNAVTPAPIEQACSGCSPAIPVPHPAHPSDIIPC